ncbi:hypothetical protein [Streptomyces goshikiensis]
MLSNVADTLAVIASILTIALEIHRARCIARGSDDNEGKGEDNA